MFKRTLAALAVVLIAAPAFVHAESVLWSGTTGTMCYARSARPYPGCQIFKLSGVIQQVAYNVRVVNAQTGAAIPSGSTVPSGTRVRYEFAPHVSEDIYWFGSGGGIDSPNGDWNEDAAFIPEMCIPKNYLGKIGLDRNRRAWVNFIVDPPAKTIAGLPAGCAAVSDGVSRECVLTGPATVSAQFQFAQTFGRYYTKFQNSDTAPSSVCSNTRSGNPQMSRNGDDVTPADDITVPAQSIAHTITVEEADGSPPSNPSLSGSGQCTVGTPYTISMTATDADGDGIKYGIDWNNDGSVDQFVPTSGFVASGSTQTASRTFAVAGQKIVRVYAQDENGLSSSWSTHTFSCAETPPAVAPSGTGAGAGSGGEGSGGFSSGSGSLSGGGGSATGAQHDLSLRVVPSIVRQGGTSRVHWSTQRMTDCSVTGDNGDGWPNRLQSPPGGERTSPIDIRTTYTLVCTGEDGNRYSKSASVVVFRVRER